MGAGKRLPEVIIKDQIESTNHLAKRLLQEGFDGEAIIIAKAQTRGQGRFGRNWHSPEGGLYMSIILRGSELPANYALYGFALANAALKVIEEITDLSVHIKWPNDLLVSGRKLGGILSELVTENGNRFHVILGIGINVNTRIEEFPLELQSISTSLLHETAKQVDMDAIAAGIFNNLTDFLDKDPSLETVVSIYKRNCITLGSSVIVEDGNRKIQGKAIDVLDTGTLLLEDMNGVKMLVSVGDIIHLEEDV